MQPPSPAPRTGAAILFFSAGIFFFAVNDALGKWLIAGYPVGQLMMLRTVGVLAFLAPMLVRRPDLLMVPGQVPLHILRGLVMAVDSSAFYLATRSLPLADVMTFYLASPLFITGLAVIWLGERIGAVQILALLVGFGGVLIALEPSGSAISPGALVALGGSVLFSTGLVVTRGLRGTHWVTLILWQFAGSGLYGAMLSTMSWVRPTLADAALMVLVGLASMACFICINKAITLASASVLAPFQYMSIVWGIMMGWLVWGDLPQVHMAVGIILIMASGLAVWLRERSRPRLVAPAAAADAPIA